MATEAQIEANRRNAQESTGPRTPNGKAAVRQNAFRHGFCSSFALMRDESKDEAQQLLAALIEENQPVGVNEEILVYIMAEHFLFQMRASTLLAEELDSADYGDKNPREVALMLRYHTTAVRGFSKALHDLRKLQKERRLQEIGFVPQKAEEPPVEPPEKPQTAAAEPPKAEPVAATQPGQPQIPVEPTADVPAETHPSTGKGPANQPHRSPKAA
jgi:hypothetical protein